MKTIATLLIALNCLIALPTLAEQSAANSVAAQPQEEVLDNAAIIELNQLSLGDSVIIEKIKSSRCNFDTTVNGLKQLKAAGVSGSIIAAMLAAKSGNGNSHPAAQTSDSNDPAAPHEAGIWLYEDNGGKPKMTQLEPSVYSQSKAGIAIFMQFGQTAKQKAVIHPAHAEFSTTNREPVFYFYFEHTQSGLGNNNGATTPNQYNLAQFEVAEKHDERTLVMNSFNAFSGGQHGADDKALRSFDFQKLSPGVYKVTPKQDLGDGEYGFYYASTTGDTTGGKVFDFGVKGSAESESAPSAAKTTNTKRSNKKNPESSNTVIVAHETAK